MNGKKGNEKERKTACEINGRFLPMPKTRTDTRELIEAVTAQSPAEPFVFIGLAMSDGRWMWDDGEALYYGDQWKGGAYNMPYNVQSGQCVVSSRAEGGRWILKPCSEAALAVCEAPG